MDAGWRVKRRGDGFLYFLRVFLARRVGCRALSGLWLGVQQNDYVSVEPKFRDFSRKLTTAGCMESTGLGYVKLMTG